MKGYNLNSIKFIYDEFSTNLPDKIRLCKKCEKPCGRRERIDTLNENDRTETLCLTCWNLLLRQ